jgi:hypothetical protein
MNSHRAILCSALTLLLLAGAGSEAARNFAAAGDKVSTQFTAHATQRSYSLWTFRRGDGGGGFGRMFEKRTAGAEVETFHNRATGTSNGDTYMYTRAFSGTSGFWTIPRPSANVWHHICIVYEAVAGSIPTIYVDGIQQSVNALSTTAGSPTNNADAYVIGGRGNDNLRTWDGRLAEFAIWNVLLSANECRALARGASPNSVRRQSLVGYWPLWGASSPEPGLPGGTATVTGATPAPHAPVGPYVRPR